MHRAWGILLNSWNNLFFQWPAITEEIRIAFHAYSSLTWHTFCLLRVAASLDVSGEPSIPSLWSYFDFIFCVFEYFIHTNMHDEVRYISSTPTCVMKWEITVGYEFSLDSESLRRLRWKFGTGVILLLIWVTVSNSMLHANEIYWIKFKLLNKK